MAFWTDSNFEPKRGFKFKVKVGNVEPFYVKKITKPKFTLQEAEHKYLNRSYFFPGHVTWDPVTVTLVDTVSSPVVQRLVDALTRSNYEDVSGTNITAEDKKTVPKDKIVTQSSSDGASKTIVIEQIDSEDVVVERIVLANAWIKSVTPTELSYDTEDLSSYDVEIRYDWAKIETPTA